MADEDYSGMFSSIAKQRQLNKQHVRNRIAQAVGGTAATLRGESAPDAFARRAPDYSSQMMTPAQKRDKQMGLLQHEEEVEQFYYDQAQKLYLKELAEEMANRRAVMTAETAQMRERYSSARARATSRRLELSSRIDEDVARGKQITNPSARLIKNLSNVTSMAGVENPQVRGDKAKNKYDRASAKNKAIFKAELGLPNATEADMHRHLETVSQSAWESDAARVGSNVTQAAESLLKDGDRDDVANGIPVLAKMGNMTTEHLLEQLGGNSPATFGELRRSQIDEQNEILDTIEKKQIERRRASASTFGSTGGMGEAQQALTAPAQARRTRAEAAPQARQQTPQAPRGAPQAPGGAPQAPGGAPQAPTVQVEGMEEEVQQPGFMGIPGMATPTSAQERTLQMFDIVEQFPDHPPAQQAKVQIMASAEFKKYASKFGANAPESMVWQEAVRDSRKKAKVGKMEFRKKRAEKRLLERPSIRVETKPPVPVMGSDKGLGESDVEGA